MKKAQLYGQVFVYVLSLLLISFILIYGYNSIRNFKQKAEQVSCLKFKNDIRNSIESILSDYGSVQRKDLQVCSGYNQVCFVESYQKERSDAPQGLIDPIIIDSIKSETGKNTFLMDNTAKDSFYAGNISVSPDVMCVNVTRGKVSLRLEGKGNRVLLSQWQ